METETLTAPEPPATDTVQQTTTTQTVSTAAPSWLHTNLRNIIALALTALVCWLALGGNEQAQAALIAAFTVLMGVIWGERSALKQPGRDR